MSVPVQFIIIIIIIILHGRFGNLVVHALDSRLRGSGLRSGQVNVLCSCTNTPFLQ